MSINQIKDILQIAQDEIGYLEKRSNAQLEDKTANAGSNNYTKYGKWYDQYYGVSGFTGTYWCHMFVSWCAMKAGITPDIIPYTASCPTGRNWFNQRGLFRARQGYTPKPGDIIYFSYDGSGVDHVGIVESLSGSRVYTIEGNTSGGSTLVDNGGGVARKNYDISYSRILGYGLPKYEILEDEEEMTQEQFNKMFKSAMDEYQKSKTYATLESVPAWGKPTVQKLISKGILQGEGGSLNLSYDLLRSLVMNDRAGIYD